ncbi:MAG: hypothetical protein IKP34_06890 [Bacteroidales bacterium]|nr:hypothetical protein [Bacteroidales bacterium]
MKIQDLKAIKRIILLAMCIAATFAAGAPPARPTTDKHIRTAKPKTLNERRRAACLPSVK